MRLNVLLLLVPAVFCVIDESKIKQFRWRGEFPVIDETVLSNPTSFDYDFSEDLRKTADANDIYDQFVDKLPAYHKFKSGRNEGVTEVPIVTRPVATWMSPTPENDIEIIPVTTPLQPTTKETTTAMPTTTTEKPTTIVAPSTRHFTEEIRSSAEDIHKETTVGRRTRPHMFRFTETTESTTETTTTPAPTTTERTTTTTGAPTTTMQTTTERLFFKNIVADKFVPHQPAPAFREHSFRGPIWRKGGVVEFGGAPVQQETTMEHQTTKSFRNQIFNRNFATVRGVFRQRFSTRTPFTTTETPTTTTQRITVAPVHHTLRPFNTIIIKTVDPLSRIIPKPVAIQHPNMRYRGPTYNCRVLNPFVDGRPSAEHDTSCVMAYPGLSADGDCRCFYKVSQRDENGCAMGFLFACKKLDNSSVRV